MRDAEEERRLVDQLRVYQLEKLEKYRAKSGWLHENPLHLLRLLRQEVEELDWELDVSGWHCGYPGALEKVLSECADVCNFAAMIADVVKARCTTAATAEPGGGK